MDEWDRQMSRRCGIGFQWSGFRFCNIGWDLHRSLMGRHGTRHTLWLNLTVIRVPIWIRTNGLPRCR